MEYSVGHADALQRLRMRSFGVVITSADSAIDEDLALLEEMRLIRPGVKCILLASHSTPDEVIAALRARVFACFTPRLIRAISRTWPRVRRPTVNGETTYKFYPPSPGGYRYV
jgi:DNA-binding NtrC family response regulator